MLGERKRQSEPKKEEEDDLEIEKRESITTNPPTSYTTANGDGLTFDPATISIFDEIQLIIDGKDVEKVKEAVSRRNSIRASMKGQRPSQQVVLEEIEQDF